MTPRIALHDRHVEARLAGFSWDDIHGYLGGKRKEAQDAGYSPDEINSFLGYQAPDAMMGRLGELVSAFGREGIDETLMGGSTAGKTTQQTDPGIVKKPPKGAAPAEIPRMNTWTPGGSNPAGMSQPDQARSLGVRPI